MGKKIFIFLLLSTLICGLLVSCGSKNPNSVSKDVSETASSSNSTKLPEENDYVEYVVNEDGTYTCHGSVYKYKLVLKNEEQPTSGDVTYVVLTNDNGLTYKDIFRVLISSSPIDVSDFVLLGIAEA